MPQKCRICCHPAVDEINELLVRGNEAYRRVAKQYGASPSSMYRHQREHLPLALRRAKDATDAVASDRLMNRVEQLEREAVRIAGKAEEAGDLRTALSGIRELTRIVELMGRLSGRFDAKDGSANRIAVTINFPVLDPTEQAAVMNAAVIDLPGAKRRLLERPSDRKPI